jgi:putative CocE/NonD family hydrolase
MNAARAGAPPRARRVAAGFAGSTVVLFTLAISWAWGAAPSFDFRPPTSPADPAAPEIMRDLAVRLIPVYQEPDADRYLANLSVLQLAARDYPAANGTRQNLRDRRRKADQGRRIGRSAVYDLFAEAKSLQDEQRLSFADAFSKAYREDVSRLDDEDAYAVHSWLAAPAAGFRDALQQALDRQRPIDSIGESDALTLLSTYISYEAYRSFGPLVAALDAEDDARRYVAEDGVIIRTPDRASVLARVIRPRNAAKPVPALFEFTLFGSDDDAKECAAHGYAGVVAYVQGTTPGSAGVVPYQHDGSDARAVIKWIAEQSWSDGRVGMFGDGYSAFTAWAAAKRLPRALKAIATSAAGAPGINLPMEGNIFQNAAYAWSLHLTNPKALDQRAYDDDAVLQALDQKWYRSGRRYRDLGRVFGMPNPIFIRWLNHPSYDRYWQKMVPFREEFAHIGIPVLTMTGYYAPSEPGDLYYFTEHHRYDPHADHTLLIGPYDDGLLEREAPAMLRGLSIDPAAAVDLRDLRYQWFDHVFKGGAAPALLKDTVNYEAMGANEWRHAQSIDTMTPGAQRYFLDAGSGSAGHRLTTHKRAKMAFVQQTVSFVDRKDAAWRPPTDLVNRSLAPRHGEIFVSEPLTQSVELAGLFSGQLDFKVNKMDMDVYLNVYERLPSGDYVRLFGPTDEFRASYAKDRVHRHLLKAGERQVLAFTSEHLTARQLQAGSRLVVVLGISKRPDREINYGTGNDVSEDSMADGRVPLRIRWYSDSFIDLPMRP